jgi:hypothetical protein
LIESTFTAYLFNYRPLKGVKVIGPNSVKDHFEKSEPGVFRAYDKLVAAIGKFGPVKVESKKTSIHLVRQSAFAGVATCQKHFVLTVKSDGPIKSSRIFKSEQVSKNRYHHEVKIASPKEINRELIGWLRKGWELS